MPDVLLLGGPLDGQTLEDINPLRSQYSLDSPDGLVLYRSSVPPDTQAEYVSGYGDQVTEETSNPWAQVVEGPPGSDGAPGPPGPQGPPGEGLHNAGAWSSGSTYQPLDAVTYNGATWIAAIPVVGIPPGTTPEQWTPITGPQGEKGDKGDQGTQGERGDMGSSSPPRLIETFTTTTLANGAYSTTTFHLGRSYRVMRVETDRPCRLRLYSTPSKAASDVTRPVTEDPTGDHGLVMEVVTASSLLALDITPQVNGSSMEDPPNPEIPATVNNLGLEGQVELTITFQTVE
jgi:hypothetical protein